jgi:hypothetical protein
LQETDEFIRANLVITNASYFTDLLRKRLCRGRSNDGAAIGNKELEQSDKRTSISAAVIMIAHPLQRELFASARFRNFQKCSSRKWPQSHGVVVGRYADSDRVPPARSWQQKR